MNEAFAGSFFSIPPQIAYARSSRARKLRQLPWLFLWELSGNGIRRTRDGRLSGTYFEIISRRRILQVGVFQLFSSNTAGRQAHRPFALSSLFRFSFFLFCALKRIRKLQSGHGARFGFENRRVLLFKRERGGTTFFNAHRASVSQIPNCVASPNLWILCILVSVA